MMDSVNSEYWDNLRTEHEKYISSPWSVKFQTLDKKLVANSTSSLDCLKLYDYELHLLCALVRLGRNLNNVDLENPELITQLDKWHLTFLEDKDTFDMTIWQRNLYLQMTYNKQLEGSKLRWLIYQAILNEPAY